MDFLLHKLLVPGLKSLLLLIQIFESVLLVRDLTLAVLVGHQFVINSVDIKLNLLHPKNALDTRLCVDTKTNINALHIVQFVFFRF
jgi:hypothetical protein